MTSFQGALYFEELCRACIQQVHKRRKQASTWRQKELGYNAKDQRLVLTTEDLAEALQEVRLLQGLQEDTLQEYMHHMVCAFNMQHRVLM